MAQKKPFVLRLSPEMYDDLEIWAAKEFRSVNGQIEFILHKTISEWKKGKSGSKIKMEYPANREE
jgi:hypothetical protein